MRTSPDRKDSGGLGVDLARYAGHGLTWALSTALFLFLGLWVDRRLGTLPVFTILGAVVGAVAGFYSLYRHLVVEPREHREEERRAGQDVNGPTKGTRESDGGEV